MISHFVNYLFHVFVGSSIGLLLNDYFIRRNPNEYTIVKNYLTDILLNLSYHSIYFYSKCQIWFVKYIATNPYYLKLMAMLEITKSIPNNFIEIWHVKDNYVYYRVPCESPDLVIAIDTSKTPAPTKIITDETIIESDIVFEESSVKFMLVQFMVGDKSYKIDLKTDKYNYYIVDNILSKDFFIFYINEYVLTKYEQHETSKFEKYSLTILDEDINTIEIDFTNTNKRIHVEKDAYKIT
jgi:hypothetical protein